MKFIISDLDGTLLDTPIHLSPDRVTKLNSLIEAGLRFSVATGRDLENTIKALNGVQLKYPAILTNGAVLADLNTSKILKFHSIPSNISQTIIQLASSFELNPMVYAYFDMNSDQIKYIKGKWGQDPIVSIKRDEFHDFLDKPCISLQFHAKLVDLEPIYHQIVKQFQKHVNIIFMEDVSYSQRKFQEPYYWLEINSREAGKGNMLKFFAEKYHISLDTIIAFGDNHNDLEMMKLAGTAITVASAPPELKAVADKIIGKNHEGAVLSYIEKNIEEIMK